MDTFEGYQQIRSLATPPLEAYASPTDAADLARRANDGMADLVARHRDRFPGFVASLPLNDVDAAMRGTERAIGDLGASGVQIFTNVGGTPIVAPRFLPLFALRSVPGDQDHHASHGGDGAVLRGTSRPRVRPARCAHVGRGLCQDAADAPPTSTRRLSDVLRRHGALWIRGGHTLRARVSSASIRCCSRPTPRSFPNGARCTSARPSESSTTCRSRPPKRERLYWGNAVRLLKLT